MTKIEILEMTFILLEILTLKIFPTWPSKFPYLTLKIALLMKWLWKFH